MKKNSWLPPDLLLLILLPLVAMVMVSVGSCVSHLMRHQLTQAGPAHVK